MAKSGFRLYRLLSDIIMYTRTDTHIAKTPVISPPKPRIFCSRHMGRIGRQSATSFAEEGASTMTAVVMKWLDPQLQSADGGRNLPTAEPAAPRIDTEHHSARRATIVIAHPEPPPHYSVSDRLFLCQCRVPQGRRIFVFAPSLGYLQTQPEQNHAVRVLVDLSAIVGPRQPFWPGDIEE
jgi:hypothetical protein